MSARKPGPPRIAVIGSIVARYDAISDAIIDTYRFLADGTGWDVSLLAAHNDFPELPVRRVENAVELLLAEEFLDADLLLYHFGIYHPVFDALLIGNGRARQAVFFHNITPPEFVPQKARGTVLSSFTQLHNLRRADRIFPVSRTNLEVLLELDFPPESLEVVPLAVGGPALHSLRDKDRSRIEVLFLSRIVKAKGILDLMEAFIGLKERALPDYRLRIVGNLEHSDPSIRDEILRRIEAHQLQDRIEFIGTVDDDARDRLLAEAHILAIPSYHEGFCKPVIEALRAGGVPILYAAHNLRYIADGLCRSVAPGDIQALTRSLAETIGDIAAILGDRDAPTLTLDVGRLEPAEFEAAVRRHVAQFEPPLIADHIRECARQLVLPKPSRSVAAPDES